MSKTPQLGHLYKGIAKAFNISTANVVVPSWKLDKNLHI